MQKRKETGVRIVERSQELISEEKEAAEAKVKKSRTVLSNQLQRESVADVKNL